MAEESTEGWRWESREGSGPGTCRDPQKKSEKNRKIATTSNCVTMHPKGTPAPASSVKAQVFEERVDLSNDMTGWQMIAVGVRRLVLAPWGVDGPPGATGVLSRGVPPVKGVWGAAPGSPPQAPIFWGFFD